MPYVFVSYVFLLNLYNLCFTELVFWLVVSGSGRRRAAKQGEADVLPRLLRCSHSNGRRGQQLRRGQLYDGRR